MSKKVSAQGKTSKAKEKKMKRKEEMEMLEAKQALVDAANSLEDPMESLAAFKKFDRNGLSLTISCQRVTNMDDELFEWCFNLVKDNMQTLYEQSDWGWDDQEKQEEMREPSAWYLIARDADKPVACVHFRFDMDDDEQVLYCYEIQLTKDVRRKGLGKFLMQILELLAYKHSMCKVMLTIFKHNSDAQNFFLKKLKYQLDESNPEATVAEAMFSETEAYCYQIISKATQLKKLKS